MEVCPASSPPTALDLVLPQGGNGFDTCRYRDFSQDPWRYTSGYEFESKVDDDDVEILDDCENGITP